MSDDPTGAVDKAQSDIWCALNEILPSGVDVRLMNELVSAIDALIIARLANSSSDALVKD